MLMKVFEEAAKKPHAGLHGECGSSVVIEAFNFIKAPSERPWKAKPLQIALDSVFVLIDLDVQAAEQNALQIEIASFSVLLQNAVGRVDQLIKHARQLT